MIKGMTGFGAAEIRYESIKGVLEIKSVNHRYMDIGYYLPNGLDSFEMKMKPLIASKIKRGRVNIFLKITKKPAKGNFFNREAVKTYLKYSKILKKEFRLKGDLSLDQLVQLPGVIATRDAGLDAKALWPVVEKSLRKALRGLITMRVREGRSLAQDIKEQLRRMSMRIKKIRTRTKAILEQKKKALTTDEFLSFRKGIDVNEEVKRLTHHIGEIRILLKANIPVGKRIDFIAQEMQRETNTIGSKVQDKIISNSVISLKSKIEKIREQAQNIE